MTAPTGHALAIFVVFAMTTRSLAAAEPMLDKWEAATESFTATRERLTELSLKAFDVAENRARKSGGAVLVERIKRDRTAFTEKGIAPRHVSLPQWGRGMEAAVSSLKLVAQKTKTSLLKDGLDKEAELVDAQLTELLGPPPAAVPIVGGSDARFYWTTKDGKNQFRLLATGDWEELTPGDGKKKIWKELSRNSKAVDLFEPVQKFAMRLRATDAHVDYTFDGSEAPQFGLWNPGRWLSASEATARLDAEDDAAEAIKQAAIKASK